MQHVVKTVIAVWGRKTKEARNPEPFAEDISMASDDFPSGVE
jgi:hypothetical protein